VNDARRLHQRRADDTTANLEGVERTMKQGN
jgi:hypothetical protein